MLVPSPAWIPVPLSWLTVSECLLHYCSTYLVLSLSPFYFWFSVLSSMRCCIHFFLVKKSVVLIWHQSLFLHFSMIRCAFSDTFRRELSKPFRGVVKFIFHILEVFPKAKRVDFKAVKPYLKAFFMVQSMVYWLCERIDQFVFKLM